MLPPLNIPECGTRVVTVTPEDVTDSWISTRSSACLAPSIEAARGFFRLHFDGIAGARLNVDAPVDVVQLEPPAGRQLVGPAPPGGLLLLEVRHGDVAPGRRHHQDRQDHPGKADSSLRGVDHSHLLGRLYAGRGTGVPVSG
jgi:hypothetical protein